MHGDGFLRANAGLATAVLGGPTFPITECNKGNKSIPANQFSLVQIMSPIILTKKKRAIYQVKKRQISRKKQITFITFITFSYGKCGPAKDGRS